MAKLTQAAQDIVTQLQSLADELGHLPSQAEFEASDMAKTVPMFRINGLLHGFDKALKHIEDPRIRDLAPEAAIQMAKDWAVESRELLTKTAWTRSLRAGGADGKPDYERLVEASGKTSNQLEFVSHEALVEAGFEPVGSSKTRYAKPKVSSATEHEAKAKGIALKGVRQAPQADDALVRELHKQEMEQRKEAGTRTGRYQDGVDKQGSQDWLGGV